MRVINVPICASSPLLFPLTHSFWHSSLSRGRSKEGRAPQPSRLRLRMLQECESVSVFARPCLIDLFLSTMKPSAPCQLATRAPSGVARHPPHRLRLMHTRRTRSARRESGPRASRRIGRRRRGIGRSGSRRLRRLGTCALLVPLFLSGWFVQLMGRHRDIGFPDTQRVEEINRWAAEKEAEKRRDIEAESRSERESCRSGRRLSD